MVDKVQNPKNNNYYWLNAYAIDLVNPLMIGRYDEEKQIWWVGFDGNWYNAGPGIDPIRHIAKPRGM